MIDVSKISDRLKEGNDGIWYSEVSSEISYPESGNEDCFEIEDNSFWFKHRNEVISEIFRQFSLPETGWLLDIGGGNGFVAEALIKAGVQTVVLEPGNEGAKNAVKRGVKQVICSTMKNAAFKNSSLGAVGMFDVLEHLEDDVAVLGEINRVLQPNGLLYLTVPAHMCLWSEEDTYAGHYRRYAVGDIKTKLSSSGFKLLYIGEFFKYLTLPIYILRTLPFLLGFPYQPDVQGDHKSGSILSKTVLDAFSSYELKRIANGEILKCGSSILAVAKVNK